MRRSTTTIRLASRKRKNAECCNWQQKAHYTHKPLSLSHSCLMSPIDITDLNDQFAKACLYFRSPFPCISLPLVDKKKGEKKNILMYTYCFATNWFNNFQMHPISTLYDLIKIIQKIKHLITYKLNFTSTRGATAKRFNCLLMAIYTCIECMREFSMTR